MDYCGDCKYLNRKKEYKPLFASEFIYKCERPGAKDNDYYPVGREACSNFIPKSPSSGDFTPVGLGGCLSTLVFILTFGTHFQDECEPLDTLRKFRDKYLMKEQYYPILHKYDELSPKICDYLQSDKKTCLETLKDYLLPLCKIARIAFLNNEDQKNYIDRFVELFNNMMESLRNKYGISEYISQSSFKKPPSGKGRRLVPSYQQ